MKLKFSDISILSMCFFNYILYWLFEIEYEPVPIEVDQSLKIRARTYNAVGAPLIAKPPKKPDKVSYSTVVESWPPITYWTLAHSSLGKNIIKSKTKPKNSTTQLSIANFRGGLNSSTVQYIYFFIHKNIKIN